jgi:hypothetical protein
MSFNKCAERKKTHEATFATIAGDIGSLLG